MESGGHILVEEVSALLVLYGVKGGERDRLIGMTKSSEEPGWWSVGLPGLPAESATLASYEAEAACMVSWEPLLVPGLVQTMEYSRAFMLADGVPPDHVELRLTARLRRQQVLRRPSIEYTAIIGEAAIRANVGGPDVMAAQLEALREIARRPNITVRVVPSETSAHPGMVGGFFLLRFASARSVVHVELARTAVFLDEEPLTGPYQEALKRIDAVAFDARESQRVIAAIVDELR